jgi:hypothetical protein
LIGQFPQLISIKIFLHQLNDAAPRTTREDRYGAIESRSRCVERMLRRASSPPPTRPKVSNFAQTPDGLKA